MLRWTSIVPATAILAIALCGAGCSHGRAATSMADGRFRESFAVNKADLLSRGSNRYFILEPGYRLSYADETTTLVITVLNETKAVDGVETRVVEERESEKGQLVEVSRNYFAIDKRNADIYYFGEDVDIYKAGKIVNHEGAWLSGVKGAKFGLMMPGDAKAGDRFYQELAPGVAMDRCQIVSTDETLTTPAGKFTRCLKTNETSALESGAAHKHYAPNVGLIQDGNLLLVKIERP